MGASASLVVDARGLRLSGIGRYLREVLRGVFADQRFGAVTLLGRPDELHDFVHCHGGGARARVVSFPYHFYSPRAQLHWAALQARGALRADVVFFPHYDVPLTDRSARTVVTVQDLGHLILRDQFPGWKRAIAGRVLARAVRRASRVTVTSGFTRAGLAERHPAIAGKVVQIPLGVNPFVPAAGLPAERVAEITRWEPFLLCVGNRKPHKNLEAAVECLHRVRRFRPGTRLVLVGEDFGEDAGVRERVRSLGLESAVVWFGRATDGELSLLYGRAVCLLFPSYFEGFGLPPLEAMAAGLPVVASDRASIPEVVGDAAAVVAPDDWDGMAAAVAGLMDSPARREDAIRRGRARAAAFRWDTTAALTCDLLWEVAGSAGRLPRASARDGAGGEAPMVPSTARRAE